MSARPKPAHAPITGFETIDGCLQIGGVSLIDLAKRIGSTPFYAYGRAQIEARVAELRTCLPADVALHYAIKANPMPAVIAHLGALVDGFDVASGGELAKVLETPMAAAHISFAGPGKTDAELDAAIAAGIIVNLESASEMRRLATLSERRGVAARVAVRVNPDFELKASGMRMGGGARPFGIDAERVPALLREMATMGLDFHGFHIFAGSQCLRADALRETQAQTVDLALRLAVDAPRPPRHVNLGGGFGIPYFPGETPLDLAAVGDGLDQELVRLRAELPDAVPVIELGRYLVGEAGIYVTRVIERKESRGQTFLITDGGLHHNLAVSGNFGQVIRRNYPLAIGNRMTATRRETVTVVGCLCTPLDLLGERLDLPAAEAGDLVVIFQSGAYGLTASPTAFLGHPPPAEILV